MRSCARVVQKTRTVSTSTDCCDAVHEVGREQIAARAVRHCRAKMHVRAARNLQSEGPSGDVAANHFEDANLKRRIASVRSEHRKLRRNDRTVSRHNGFWISYVICGAALTRAGRARVQRETQHSARQRASSDRAQRHV